MSVCLCLLSYKSGSVPVTQSVVIILIISLGLVACVSSQVGPVLKTPQ